MTDAFEEIYKVHFLYVRGFLLRLCNYDPLIAEDLTQETFFQAYKGIHKFKGNCHVETWLCSIAKNVFYTYLRKEERQKSFKKTKSDDKDSMYFIQDKQNLVYDIVSVLNQFPKRISDILAYRLFQDMPYAEISKILGISASSAKVLYHRGRIKLKKILEEHGYEI